MLANKQGFYKHRQRKTFWKDWDEINYETYPELSNDNYFFEV